MAVAVVVLEEEEEKEHERDQGEAAKEEEFAGPRRHGLRHDEPSE